MALLKDVQSLGAGVVPRAIYELSKRCGSHTLVFGTVKSGRRLRSTSLARTPPHDSFAAKLCITDAGRIMEEGLLVFGRRVPIHTPTDWVTDPESCRVWPRQAWWTVDIRSDRRLGDVKWVWEIGRHRDLVVLARAAAIAPDQAQWAVHLERLIIWWCEANPLESSVHWYSNLELALRLLAWDQVVGLAGAHLAQRTLDLMALHVAQMRRHLWRDLPYTMSSMRNNHMLGDALGLGLADVLTGRPASKIRTSIAERMWQAQLTRQVRPDGSMIEDSISYHRFVLEMLCARYLTGDWSPELVGTIGQSSRYLADLGALDGPVPQYGDWDEGRVLASSGDSLDVGNSVALGLAIAGELEGHDWRERFDLLDWYLPPSNAAPSTSRARASNAGKAGEIAMARRGEWQAWMKCGSGPSHGHADLGHVSARYRGQWVLVDPGTGTYNGPLDVRNGFRVSRAHNVLRPCGEGQIEPHRAFRWMSAPNGLAGRVHELASATVLWGAHDAYRRRYPSPWPWRMARACVVTESGIAVIDWREGGGEDFELTIPFDPSIDVEADAVTVGGARLALRLPVTARIAVGEKEPFLGWYSRTYGSWVPAPWLVGAGSCPGPLVWSIGDIDCEVSEGEVQVSGIQFRVEWSRVGVTMDLMGGKEPIADTVLVGRPV